MDFGTEATEVGAGTYVVAAWGELDQNTAPQLKARLVDVVERLGGLRIAVDLMRVEFLDSSSLGPLVEAQRRLGERSDGKLAVACNAQLSELLERTALSDLVPTFPSREKALGFLDAAHDVQ